MLRVNLSKNYLDIFVYPSLIYRYQTPQITRSLLFLLKQVLTRVQGFIIYGCVVIKQIMTEKSSIIPEEI